MIPMARNPSSSQALDTALMRAIMSDDARSVNTLVVDGVDVNVKDSGGLTPLMWAAFNGHLAVLKALLDAGADTNAKSVTGRTALMFGAQAGHLAAVNKLLVAGADAEATDDKGLTARKIAERHKHDEIARALDHDNANQSAPRRKT